MDKQAYIQSGIIEAYVLGLSTPEENTEVEMYISQYPEVEQAIDEFSASLEQELKANAIQPPLNVKENIMYAIQDDFADDRKKSVLTIASVTNDTSDDVKIKKHFPWRMIAAASVMLLVISAALNFHYYGKYSKAIVENENLLAERNTMQANIQVYKTSLSQYASATAMMADPNMVMVKMDGQGENNESMATVFWNSKTKEVYVMPNILPAPIAGKQYQLWAMVDGIPVDAGLLDLNCIGVCKLKNTLKRYVMNIVCPQRFKPCPKQAIVIK